MEYSLFKERSLGCSLLIITLLSEAASLTAAHPSYFVITRLRRTSRIAQAFIFFSGSRNPDGAGNSLRQSFGCSPLHSHPQPAEVWCRSRAPKADVARRAEHSLSVRNQETHSLQRCTYLWGFQLCSPRRGITETRYPLDTGGI